MLVLKYMKNFIAILVSILLYLLTFVSLMTFFTSILPVRGGYLFDYLFWGMIPVLLILSGASSVFLSKNKK